MGKFIVRQIIGLFLAILLVTTICSTPSLGQSSSDVWFRNYGLNEGLPNSTVTYFHQDRQGFIWLSTQGGIVRYDGYDVKSYTIPTENNIPTSSAAGVMLEDSSGVLWAGHIANHYIARYDSVRDTFHYRDMEKELGIDNIGRVHLLGIDKQQNLWASVLLSDDRQNPIIIRLNTKDQSIHPYINDAGQSTIEHGLAAPQYFAGHINKSSFLAEKDSTVWIGADDGLIKIGSNGSATSYASGEDGLQKAPVHQILDVNCSVWAATDSGLVAYDEPADRFDLVPHTPTPLQQEPVQNLYRDNSGAIWITGEYNTYRYQDGTFSNLNKRDELAPLERVIMIPEVETKDQIWFINQEYFVANREDATNGFTIYDKRQERFTLYSQNLQGIGIENKRYLSGLFRDQSGSIWLTSPYSGLMQYPSKYKKFDTHFTSEIFKEQLNETPYYRVDESPNGNYFASSFNGNIFVKKPTSDEEVIFYQPKALSSNARGDRNAIIDLYWESPNQLLLATEWSGLQRITYDPITLEIQDTTVWEPPQMKSGLPLNMTTDNGGQLWVGTTMGAIKADLKNSEFTRVDAYEVPGDGYDNRNRFGQRVFKDSEGYLWYYFPEKAGIKRLDPNNETAKAYNTSDDVPDEHAISYVVDLLETRSGDIFIINGNEDELYVFNPDSARFEPFLDNPLPVANSLAQNQQGDIVVGTYGYGYFWIDPETRTVIRRLNTNNGLASDVTLDLKIDSTGTHWMLHALGVTKYAPKKELLVNYGADRGLPGTQSETGYWFFEGRDGTLFPMWMSSKGISSFNLYDITTNNYSASPTFTEVSAGNTKLPLSSNGGVTVSPGANNITISYSALQFSEPSRNEYRYRLNDGEWTDWESSHQASFAQLASGDYSFNVQSRNADRIVAPQTSSYLFTIAPPWYKSSIAYLLYVIFGIGGLSWAAVWYSNYRTQQRAIRMRAEQAEELAKIDRMKTNLLTNISHELRTPLTLVLGPLEQLHDEASKLGENWKRRLDIALRNGNRLHQLVEQVRDLTRLNAKQLELELLNIELNSFLRRLSESFESLAEQNEVTIKTNFTEDLIQLQADADKLEKAIVNLISNAIKFTPNGGTVTLAAKTEGNTAKISIADTGRGIAANRLPHIFDRFHSSSEEISGGGKGLGVGLAITKEFIELHDGTITVESEEGSGTTFTITLPQKGHDPALDSQTAKENQTPIEQVEPGTDPKFIGSLKVDGKSLTVLIVEDNNDMCSYIADLLNDENLLVETASNGLEAQEQLTVVDPDLIISDIMMPEMDGFTFIEHIRSDPQYRLTPVVMLSARAELEDRIQGYKIGVSDYLVKPFDETELKARVNNLLQRKTEREKHLKENGNGSVNDTKHKISLVEELKRYVEANLSDSKIEVERLSQKANLSQRQLYHNLKAETGCAPSEFVREIRLYNARDMLDRKQKKTVSEVAYAVGFSTPSYFSKLFKDRFGRSPSEYGT